MTIIAEQARSEPFEATVVSVIIRDFIHLTERLSAASLTDLMSDYYEKVCVQVAQQKGVLTSISNYSMMVTFSAEAGEDVHARRALRCALAIAMIAYQTRFWIRQAFPEQGLDKFGVGIGIHSGELVFARFGLLPHVQHVASGHAVSVASLLAVKSKELDWNVVCSEQALAAAGQGVQIRRRALIGAEWLRNPVRVVEAVVVRDNGEEMVESGGAMLDTTLAFDRGSRSGRYPAFDPAKPAAAGEAGAEFPAIPGYRCLHPIGKGGMSRVFLVERLRDGARLALKFADGSVSEDSEVLYRFVEQIGSTGIAPERAWKVLREMVEALVEVHRAGIIHRDIKPENILLREDGSAVLGDFGVARRIYRAHRSDQMDYIVGTPYFMSPEQALGEEEGESTDIYSMGAVFYNMLTGEKPYQGETLEQIVQQHLHAPVPRLPSQFRHLQFFLDRMMAKDKEQRYSASALLDLLGELSVST